jgi:hypothetical protein
LRLPFRHIGIADSILPGLMRRPRGFEKCGRSGHLAVTGGSVAVIPSRADGEVAVHVTQNKKAARSGTIAAPSASEDQAPNSAQVIDQL